jgi:hypothetical protein
VIVYRSKDEHNVKVKKRILEELSVDKENVYSKILIESKQQPLYQAYFSYIDTMSVVVLQGLFRGILSPASGFGGS